MLALSIASSALSDAQRRSTTTASNLAGMKIGSTNGGIMKLLITRPMRVGALCSALSVFEAPPLMRRHAKQT